MIRNCLTLALLAALSTSAFALSNTFTYQGSLQDGAAPANGSYDLQFALQTQAGVPVGSALLRDDVVVTGGVFTVELDFGASISSADFQLQIGVRPGASAGAFTTLSPATKIAPTPQAQVAGLAQEAITVSPGAIGAAQINQAQVQARVASSCPAGQSIRVVNANGTVTCESSSSGPVGPVGPAGATGATGLTGPVGPTGPQGAAGSADAWGRSGTSGTNPGINFLGTTDLQPLNIATNGSVSLFLEPSSILFGGVSITSNIIGGSNQNRASSGVRGAAIAGGGVRTGDTDPDFIGEGGNRVSDHYGFIGGGFNNVAGNLSGTLADAAFNVVGGGSGNSAAGKNTVIGGGFGNSAGGINTVVSGGFRNAASNDASVITGGSGNIASGFHSMIGGGQINQSTGSFSSVGGGSDNCAGGDYSWAGGRNAKIRPGSSPNDGTCVANSSDADGDEGTFVWADSINTGFASTGPNQFLIRAQGGMAINTNTPTASASLTVAPLTSGLTSTSISMLGEGDSFVAARFGNLVLSTDSGGKFIRTNDRFGVNRLPIANLLEVAGDASKTTAGAWLANSDRRIKTSIETIPNALDRLSALRPVTFHYTTEYLAANPEIKDVSYYNVIAQEFQTVFPDSVKGSGEYLSGKAQTPENEILQVDTYPAQILAIAAIQELNAKLELENAALKKSDTELRERLAAIEAKLSR